MLPENTENTSDEKRSAARVDVDAVHVEGMFDPAVHRSWGIEVQLVSGWETSGVLDDGSPMRFCTAQAAQEEVATLISDVAEAVACGDMADEYMVEDYRVVPCPEDPNITE